jgi:hypothetical protein
MLFLIKTIFYSINGKQANTPIVLPDAYFLPLSTCQSIIAIVQFQSSIMNTCNYRLMHVPCFCVGTTLRRCEQPNHRSQAYSCIAQPAYEPMNFSVYPVLANQEAKLLKICRLILLVLYWPIRKRNC